MNIFWGNEAVVYFEASQRSCFQAEDIFEELPAK